MKHFKILLSIVSLAILLSSPVANASIIINENDDNDSFDTAQSIDSTLFPDTVSIINKDFDGESYDYFTFAVTMGQSLIFDIDFNGCYQNNSDCRVDDHLGRDDVIPDLLLQLFDESENLLALNDDEDFPNGIIDPYLVWNFTYTGNATVLVSDYLRNEVPRLVNYSLNISTVPEPSIIALFAVGLLGLGFAGRRRKS